MGMFEGWHLNDGEHQPPYQKPCRLSLIGGEEVVAELYSFNQQYHSKCPVPDRWRRVGKNIPKRKRWIGMDKVVMWKLIEEEENMDGCNERQCCDRESTISELISNSAMMDRKALDVVEEYIFDHLDKSDGCPVFEVYIVWKCKTLQNWKWLISSTLSDGMYYELTFNGDRREFYLDAYKKFENVCIPFVKE